MSNDQPKKTGRPRKDTERRERAWFSVSADDMRWLLTLPNRSEWLRKCIETARTRSNNSSAPPPEAS